MAPPRTESITITPSMTAPAQARAFVERLCSYPTSSPEAAACVRLAASELVSNAVRHGDTSEPLRVTVTRNDAEVRVDVETSTPVWDERVDNRVRRVLAGVCDRWGIDPSGSGSLGWFEVSISNEPDADQGSDAF